MSRLGERDCRRRLRALALALSASLVLAAASSQPASAVTDGRIDVSGKGAIRSFGGFDPDRDPSPTAAAAVFGPGTVLSDSDTSCEVSYPSGVTIDFADFGNVGISACDPAAGKAQRLTAAAIGWATNRGLAIGDRARKMKKLYPEDKLRRGKYELIDKKSFITVSGRSTVLSAFVTDGTVTAFEVFAGRAGD